MPAAAAAASLAFSLSHFLTFLRHAAGHEPNVIRVRHGIHRAAALEGHVELARQVVELAVIENVVVQRVREGPRVQQLLRVEAGGRRRGDVADVVHATALRGEAERLQAREDVDQVRRANLANLQVRACGDGGLAVAIIVRDVRQAAHLHRREFTRRDAAAEHEAVLRGRYVEHPEVAEAKRVFLVRQFPRLRVRENTVPAVQRMLLVLPTLLLGHVAERRAIDGLLGKIRAALRRVAGELSGRGRADIGMQAALRHTRHEAGEKFLLLGGERPGGSRGGWQFEGCGAHIKRG